MTGTTGRPGAVDVSVALRFMNVLDAAHRSRRETARLQDVTRLPLTHADVRALRLVMTGPITITALATRLGVDLSRASRHVSRLVDLGLLTRSAFARPSAVSLSREGAAVMDRWQSSWEGEYLAATADWWFAELERFADLVGRLHARLVERQRVDRDGTTGERAPDGWEPRTAAVTVGNRAQALVPFFNFVDWVITSPRNADASTRLVERARSPIPPTLVRVLALVARHGPLDITALADRTGVVPSRAGRHVRELEAHGYVVRALDPHDRRSHRIKVTAKGQALLRRIRVVGEAGLAQAVADWDEAEVDELMGLLRRLRSALPASPTVA